MLSGGPRPSPTFSHHKSLDLTAVASFFGFLCGHFDKGVCVCVGSCVGTTARVVQGSKGKTVGEVGPSLFFTVGGRVSLCQRVLLGYLIRKLLGGVICLPLTPFLLWEY